MTQMTLDPKVREATLEGLFLVMNAREDAKRSEQDLIKSRKAADEQLAQEGEPDGGAAPSKRYTELSLMYTKAVRGLDRVRAQIRHLADELQRGLKCLQDGELFEPELATPSENDDESPAEREQMKLPINRGDATVGEAIVHRPSVARNLDDQAEGAELAARPIGDLHDLVPTLRFEALQAIKKAAGGSLWQGKTLGSFCDFLKLGGVGRLPRFVKDTTLEDARAIWTAEALRPLLGQPPNEPADGAIAEPAPAAVVTGRPAATDELEGIVGTRAAAILIDAGLVSLNDVGIYIGEHGGSDALTTKVGVTAKAVKELSRAIAERDAARATGKPKATTVKPGKPGK